MAQEIQTKKGPSILVIALGLICIILAASTIAAFTLNTSDTDKLDEKDKTIASLNTQIETLTKQVATLIVGNDNEDKTATINSLNAQLTTAGNNLAAANANIADLRNIVELKMTKELYNKTITQDAGKETHIFQGTIEYAGYLVIEAKSNSTSTKGTVSYNFKNAPFKFDIDFGDEKTAKTTIIPVLPAEINIVISNTNDKVTSEDEEKPATIYDNKAELIVTLIY